MEAIPALPRYSVWCPIQENFLVMRGERGRGAKREGGRNGGKWERGEEGEEGEREGERRMKYEMILYLGRR